jgi:hypothetical protein
MVACAVVLVLSLATGDIRGVGQSAASDRDGRALGFLPPPVPIDWVGGQSADPTAWGLAGNWNPNTDAPDGAGIPVRFGGQLAAYPVVDLRAVGRTVGSLTFAAGTNTTVQSSGNGILTLDGGDSAATLSVAGIHHISAAIVLDSDADIRGTGVLYLSGGISGQHTLNVLSGSLVASSIQVDALNIGSGASVTISPTAAEEAGHAMPEPSPCVLLGVGAAGLLACAWRRRAT